MNYRLSSEAEDEVEQAVDFYTQQASKLVALAFLAEFARTARLVAANPCIGTRTSRG
jgi:plasmid stabilization system protein ParE